MIDYGEKPSNQNKLEIEDDSGFLLMQEARQWVKDNPKAWELYLMIAKAESMFGELSPNYAIQILRHRHKVSIRNGYAPVLARIAMEQDSMIRFRLAKSKVDGFCEVKL